MTVLNRLLSRAEDFSARHAAPSSLIGADLGIDREDFVEFLEDIREAYAVDPWPLVRTDEGRWRDVTVSELAAYIEGHRA
jgi:hypothetical protein